MAAGDAIDFRNMQQIQKLHTLLGVDECERLGFTCVDNIGVVSLSVAGLGYLIAIEAEGVSTLAAAFAAGYQCAAEFHQNPEAE